MLPPNWVEKIDPTSGKSFYVNRRERRTQWTRPTFNDGCSKTKIRGKIDSDRDALDALHKEHPWVPSSVHIRPTAESRKNKERWLKDVMSKYANADDLIMHTVFGIEPTLCEDSGRLVVRKERRTTGKRNNRLVPNIFPYDLPEGTQHFVMWYNTKDRRKDAQITSDIDTSIKSTFRGDYDFAWYENPVMTLPQIFHVQVFVTRLGP